MRLLVTGAAGFIGSTFVRIALDARPGDRIVVLDKLTYAGRRENLAGVEDRIDFREGAIEDRGAVREAMEGCDAVVLPSWEDGLGAYLAERAVRA